jgi:choline dehydrogenase-like flavoprotein
LVEGLELDGKRAVGVRWRQGGELRSARCRGEVILSAGAIGSPHIMMLSGIGPTAQLSHFGIPVTLDKPGVGANLHDHLQLRMIFKVSGVKTLNETYASVFNRLGMGIDYALRRRGPMTMAPSQLGAFTKSDRSQSTANIQYHVQPLSLEKFGEPLHPFPAFTASVTNVRPTSRGALTLKSKDPSQAPAISPNYLATPETSVLPPIQSASRARSLRSRRCRNIRRSNFFPVRRYATMMKPAWSKPPVISERQYFIRWVPRAWAAMTMNGRSWMRGCVS